MPRVGSRRFRAGLTAPYALGLGPRTAYWGPAPGQRRPGVIKLDDFTSWTMRCPCYIVRDEFNPKLTLGGVPGDVPTLHMFEYGIADTRNANVGIFCCHTTEGQEFALLGAIWGPNYNRWATPACTRWSARTKPIPIVS
jgi:hypothetical protein